MTDQEIRYLYSKYQRNEITLREFSNTLYENGVPTSRFGKIMVIDTIKFSLKCALITVIFIIICWSIIVKHAP
jgi:hypothetical protein